MKKKTIVKIVLDVLMTVVIALMYRKQALGLAFHEIGGLALIGVFFIHKGLNFTWIRRVTVKLTKADARTRLMWIVDALMLVSFLAVGVSGIFISKVAFPGLAVRGGPWKSIHYGSAALALMLVGVHLGLHFRYLRGIFSRWVRLPRVAAAALAAVIFVYGVYGIATTSFTRWLSMPFTWSAEGGEGFRGSGQFHGARNGSDGSSVNSNAQLSGRDSDPSSQDFSAHSDSDSTKASGVSESTAAASGETGSMRAYTSRRGEGFGDRGGKTTGAGGALVTFLQYFSIMFVFAALTTLLSRLFKGRKLQAKA